MTDKKLKHIIAAISTLLFHLLLNYLMLPKYNFRFSGIYFYIILLITIYVSMLAAVNAIKKEIEESIKESVIGGIAATGILLIVGLVALFSSSMFNAEEYSKLITIGDKLTVYEDGETEFLNTAEHDFTISDENIPEIDNVYAEKLANDSIPAGIDTSVYNIGEFHDIVIDIANIKQLNDLDEKCNDDKSEPCERFYSIAPLEYKGFFKYMKNKDEGINKIILVNKSTKEVIGYDLKEPIFYTQSAYFSKDLKRHVYKNYSKSAKIIDWALEIDDEGNAFYIGSQVSKSIGIMGGSDISGVVKVNPNSGDIEYLSVGDIKNDQAKYGWIDTVYPFDLLQKQLNYHGKYQDGWINSWTAQSGVKITTEGSRRIMYDDGNVYHYTSYTSANADTTSLAAILVNTHNGEVIMYEMNGATEQAAMETAVSSKSNHSVDAAFPLLLINDGKIRYYVPLKNNDRIQFAVWVDYDDVTSYEDVDRPSGDVSAGNTITDENVVIETDTTMDEKYLYFTANVDSGLKVFRISRQNYVIVSQLNKGSKIAIQFNDEDTTGTITSLYIHSIDDGAGGDLVFDQLVFGEVTYTP